jgi:hypothetical protein
MDPIDLSGHMDPEDPHYRSYIVQVINPIGQFDQVNPINHTNCVDPMDLHTHTDCMDYVDILVASTKSSK